MRINGSNYFKIALVAALPSVAACSTAAPPSLQRARMNLQDAQHDSQLSQQAPVALYEANQLLLRAENVWDKEEDKDEVRHLAYMVDRKIDLAHAQAQQKAAEAQARELSTRAQKLAAERARTADTARRLAQNRAEEARQARLDAKQARRDAEEQARAAKLAEAQAEAQTRAAQKAQESQQEALAHNKEPLSAREVLKEQPGAGDHDRRIH
jgi:hypothetical protein